MNTQTQYRIFEGRRVQWWTCTDCGLELGPAAAQFRLRRRFPFPIAYVGRDGRRLCGECLRREMGFPVMQVMEAVS